MSSFFSVKHKISWYLRVAKSSSDFVIGINLGTVKYDTSLLEYELSNTIAVKQNAPIMILKDSCLNFTQFPLKKIIKGRLIILESFQQTLTGQNCPNVDSSISISISVY